jgi:hypothetical protein
MKRAIRVASTLFVLAAMAAAPASAAERPDDGLGTPQVPTLRLAAPLTPDGALPILGGYSSPGVATDTSWQFGNNIATTGGALYPLFQKGAFPFRRH